MTAGVRLADRFVLKQELGRGATGVVWEAWDEAAERPVAVKLLHDGLTGNATGRRALEAEAAAAGVYLLRQAAGDADATLVLQGSGVTLAFVQDALPRLLDDGVDLNVVYVASPELFDRQPEERKAPVRAALAGPDVMGVTGFTLQTMYRWVRSDLGREYSLHPFSRGHYLGSGEGDMVIHEAGLDGDGQYRAVHRFLDAIRQ